MLAMEEREEEEENFAPFMEDRQKTKKCSIDLLVYR